jgi:uncharacterized protein with gpF-like domain
MKPSARSINLSKRKPSRAASLEAALAPIFRRQGVAIVRKLRDLQSTFNEAGEDPFDRLFDSAILDTSSLMQDAIDSAVKGALLAGAKQLISDFSADTVFSLTNPRAVAYTDTQAAQAISKIDSTTREEIRQLIKVAVSNGTPYTTLAKQLKDRYSQFAIGVPQRHIRSRAELIAITEIGNAYSEGNLIAARLVQSDGIAMQKQWANVGDRRVSAGCLANTRAGWLDLDKAFPSGDDRPLRFPGCRCAALYRRKQ